MSRKTKYERRQDETALYVKRAGPAPCRRWGSDVETEALRQMDNACRIPVAVAGALMPDAHMGYGLPIGGVLATERSVIPYAVGVDIACRMKLSVLDVPPSLLDNAPERLENAIRRGTCFGVGQGFRRRKEHAVMDADWSVSPITRDNKDTAWFQLGSSGSGNHFVEFGILTLEQADLGLEAGAYLALLSHSGSRGTGGHVASHYSRLAMRAHPELPRELLQLAWLDVEEESGREYWAAMELMGRYAAANHELIHRDVLAELGASPILTIENHHNFAWRETHGGNEVIVHRKGATPAGREILGIIPGSMATPGYVVRGKGLAASLCSASHGAGRRLSRTATRQAVRHDDLMAFLRERGIRLMSAGLDEAPVGYKDIESVMREQSDLVERVARFDPKLVKMSPGGPRED